MAHGSGSRPRDGPQTGAHTGEPMDTPDIKALEQLVDELIARSKRLADENRALRNQHTHLLTERAALIEKTEHARNRVESMIASLKSMEM